MKQKMKNDSGQLVSLSSWLISRQPSSLPDDIKLTARRCIIDTLGVMLAGSDRPVTRGLRSLVVNDKGRSSLTGTRLRASAQDAALVNATAAHAFDFDDNCYAGFIHGSAVIVPAALAVAEDLGASGEDFLTAVAVGSECLYRLCKSLKNISYHHGWWTTGTLGPVGACSAAARLLGLNEEQTAQALAMALSSGAGTKAVFGTDCKPLMAGYASQRGVMAALLARNGVGGPLDLLSHSAGLVSLCNEGQLESSWLQEDCPLWCLRDPGIDIKRIPVCLSSHAAVDAVLELSKQQTFSVEDIASIECDVPDIVRINLIYDQPVSGQQAQFSLPFAIANTLLHGDIRLSHLSEDNIRDSRLRSVMRKVSYHTSERWRTAAAQGQAPEGAEVSIHLHSGAELKCYVAKARGAATHPINRQELSNKFMQCCENKMNPQKAGWLLDQLWQVDRLDSVLRLEPGDLSE